MPPSCCARGGGGLPTTILLPSFPSTSSATLLPRDS
jgi:hypothetical protein